MISIFDLNIWNYNAPWEVRREGIVQVIRQSDPDLVALQEVTYLSTYAEDPHHQADQLLAQLPGYRLIWQPAMYYAPAKEEGAIRWEGLAIMSRLPIVDHRHIWLSRDREDQRDGHQRIVLGVRAMTAQGPFWLFTTHLSLSARARERTIVEVYRFVRDTAGGEPFAITGDFNARPDDSPIRFLVGEETLERRRSDWADAWACRHPDEPGYTHSAWEPNQRIDYLFVPRADMVRQINIAADRPDEDGVYPSDHLGLYAQLTR